MRSWLAYQLMRWALWCDTDTTVRMALALSAESARRELEARGLHLVPDDNGVPTLQPINEQEPTVH
jgi:hypothetical protein